MAEGSNSRFNGGPELVVEGWQLSREARIYLNSIFKRKQRTQFGLLEHPSYLSPLIKKSPVHTCKMFLYGKSGIGKTSTVLKLAGQLVPQYHQETMGIQTTSIYWPVKLTGKSDQVDLLEIEFWDTGERALRKFDHILPSCLNSTNCIAFVFSFADRSSWIELPDIISQATSTGQIESHLKVVIATRADSAQSHVTKDEIAQFEYSHQMKVLSIGNVNNSLTSDGTIDGLNDIKNIANFLNTLAQLVLDHNKKELIEQKLEDIEISDV